MGARTEQGWDSYEVQGNSGMPDTEALLERITALRLRLKQARGLVDDARNVATTLDLERRVQSESDVDLLLDATLAPLDPAPKAVPLPACLTARARRLLETAQGLWQKLRQIGDDLERLGLSHGDSELPSVTVEPIETWYAATVAMTETALRMIGSFPESTGTQLRLADGVAA